MTWFRRCCLKSPTTPSPASNRSTVALPMAGASLQALMSPAPPYPPQAVRDGLTGIVELEILVGVDGRPVEVTIVRSSGHRMLDQAARRVVMTRWTFRPAMRDGQAVQAIGRVPIEFVL
jgi:protein TonB